MKIILFFTAFCWLTSMSSAFGMSAEDMLRLKQSGISDETVKTIAGEKALETCLFSVDEIIALRKAGISDDTVRMLVSEGSFLKDAKPVIYGRDISSVKFTTAADIVDLKKAGISEETIRAIILCGSHSASKDERDKAWDMLKNMGIIIDQRINGN